MKVPAVLLWATVALGGCESFDSDGHYDRSRHLWSTDHGTFGRDPISGGLVWITAAVTRSYQGEMYYFESEEHAREFSANPARFTDDDRDSERGQSALQRDSR